MKSALMLKSVSDDGIVVARHALRLIDDAGGLDMADVSERLDRIEQALGTANQQLGEVNARLDNHDGRFNQIDERFNKVDERFDSLESDMQELRMLEESNSDRIKKIADVQSRHGEKLDGLAKAMDS
ncbi:MAG TPA: hypothetical protein VKB50_06275 [Vicinamibacterales bacterium]|nr:hypothetical protein [Vicinamibacterales bacterium]